MISRRAVAAGLWLLLAFLVWNVRFDYGVRRSASTYLERRDAYLKGTGPGVEMSSAMRDGVAQSARAATLVATPFLLVAGALRAARRWSTRV